MKTKISISFQWILLPLFYAISRVIKEQVFHYGNHTNNISKGFSFPLANLFRIGTNPAVEDAVSVVPNAPFQLGGFIHPITFLVQDLVDRFWFVSASVPSIGNRSFWAFVEENLKKK